jgi:hypothetical protein
MMAEHLMSRVAEEVRASHIAWAFDRIIGLSRGYLMGRGTTQSAISRMRVSSPHMGD